MMTKVRMKIRIIITNIMLKKMTLNISVYEKVKKIIVQIFGRMK